MMRLEYRHMIPKMNMKLVLKQTWLFWTKGVVLGQIMLDSLLLD